MYALLTDNVELTKKYIKKGLILLILTLITDFKHKLGSYVITLILLYGLLL